MTGWKQEEETLWLGEVCAQSLQSSIRHLDSSFTSFFKKKTDYPKFKSRHDRQAFSNPQGTKVDFTTQRVQITKFKEGIKAKLTRQFDGKIKTSTVSKTKTGKYYISILVETAGELPVPPTQHEDRTLGLDLGIKSFLTDSNGNKVDNPRVLSKHLKRLRRAQRKLSRKVKGSRNRDKARHRVAIIHERISNIRNDFLHKLTTGLVKNQDYDSFAIEDLGIKDMMQKGTRTMSRAIGDVSWAEFRRQLTYKAAWKGKNVIVIGRFEPSSRLCSDCGRINRDLTLADREWQCVCGAKHDRDTLAARNIRHFAFCEQNTYCEKQLVPIVCREIKPAESPVRVTAKQEDSN